MGERKILIIEDDAPTIELYQEIFKNSGLTTEIIVSGKEAMEKIHNIALGKDSPPKLVILDILLPEVNGLEILEDIRRYELTGRLPVIILSNYSDVEAQKKALALKAEKYIIKTQITPPELLKLIKSRLGA